MRILSIMILSFFISEGISQTATNFTVTDCDSVTYDLFSEIDSGKVIVLCWVMPCPPCVVPTKTAFNVVKRYQTSHPGKVLFFLVDDYANTTCSTLNSWAQTNEIITSSFSRKFSNPAIDMTHYGTPGMPKIVVVGGTARSVYYNENTIVNVSALKKAINNALASVPLETLKKRRR
ncbi:MAG: hypothetical protein PHT69_14150 [Bacteroidales bacterium]|nr:hypothetical protein [Bacteroidales bacterium]